MCGYLIENVSRINKSNMITLTNASVTHGRHFNWEIQIAVTWSHKNLTGKHSDSNHMFTQKDSRNLTGKHSDSSH